jgi:epoxyqueuosine reductase
MLLLHVCCSPCLLAPLKDLKEKGIGFDALFFNPNIHPLSEYLKRRESLRDLQVMEGFNLIEAGGYPYEDFLKKVSSSQDDRCIGCYSVRLDLTARYALENGYDAFSTTLLYSIYQKHELIREIGAGISKELSIPFYYDDWRRDFKYGVNESRRLGLYRQSYCGCIYSEYERYKNKL